MSHIRLSAESYVMHGGCGQQIYSAHVTERDTPNVMYSLYYLVTYTILLYYTMHK